jgi:hypothetical protein
LTLGLGLALAGPLRAQPALTADEIIAKHIAARGGADKLKALQSLRIQRTVATMFSDIKLVIEKQRPNLYRSQQQVAQQPPLVRGFDGAESWESNQGKVSRRPPPIEAEMRDADADFDGPLVDYKAKGHTVALAGKEGGQYKLTVTMKGGAVRHYFIDAATFLEKRQVFTLQTPAPAKQPVEITLTFSDYRDVQGVKMPFAIDEARSNGQEFAHYTTTIDPNPTLDASAFKAPAAKP